MQLGEHGSGGSGERTPGYYHSTGPPTDLIGTPVSLNHQKVTRSKSESLNLAIKQLDLMDFAQVKTPSLDIGDPKKRISVKDRASLGLLLNGPPLDLGDRCRIGPRPARLAGRSCCEHLGQFGHQGREVVAEDLDGLADAAVFGEGDVVEGVGRDAEFAGNVVLHPGQPLELLHGESDPPLLLCAQPPGEAFLDLVTERDEFLVLMQRVPYQRDDVGERALPGAAHLRLVEHFVSVPQDVRGPLARRPLDRLRPVP